MAVSYTHLASQFPVRTISGESTVQAVPELVLYPRILQLLWLRFTHESTRASILTDLSLVAHITD